jgi:uncharacterized protein (TIGR00296 family)
MTLDVIDPDEISDEEGELLVRIARQSVEYWFKHRDYMPLPSNLPEKLLKKGAAFVTIETFYGPNERELRGCIGFIEPIKPLAETVRDVALEAAFRDPRFPPLREEELERVTFEVSVLSKLEEAPQSPEGRLKFVEVGRDGLVVERGWARGLLLPQVPVEYGWDVETFLSETCLKAGLWPDCWLDPKTKVYRFRARLWREERPKGPISRRDLKEELRSMFP